MTSLLLPPWGQIVNGKKAYHLHDGQRDAVLSDTRFTAFIAGTGSGKTALGPLWVARQIEKCIQKGITSEILGMVIAPTFKVLKRATAPTLVNMFKGTPYEGRYVPSESQYFLPNNLGVIWLLSADNADGLEGGQFHFIWADEAGQMKETVWVAIQGRTGLFQSPILFTSTPYRMNWLKFEIVDRAMDGDEDYKIITCSSTANPAYTMDEYERARRTLPPALFTMRYDGHFVGSDSQIYNSFDRAYNVRPCDYDPSRPLIVTSDFNVDPMAWAICQRWENILKVIGEIYIEGIHCTTKIALDVLFSRYRTHQAGFQFFGDASSGKRQTNAPVTDFLQIHNDERFIKLGRTMHYPDAKSNAPGSVGIRIACMNGALCNAAEERHLFIDGNRPNIEGRLPDSNCPNLIKDLDTAYYKDGTTDPFPTKRGLHITDALGYLVQVLYPLKLKVADSGPRKISVVRYR